MFADVKVSDFILALNAVAWTVDKRNSIPILANVRLCVTANRIELCGTDLDNEVSTSAPASATQDGAVTVSAFSLGAILKTLDKDARVTISGATADRPPCLTLICADADLSLACLPVEDFPVMELPVMVQASVTVAPETLKDMLRRAEFAISTEETRYYLNGLCLEAPSGMFRMIATDGHRLAVVSHNPVEPAIGFNRELLPSATVRGMLKLLNAKKIETPCTIEYRKDATSATGKFYIAINGTRIIAKSIDGTFPDYQRVIPSEFHGSVTLPVARFASAIKRAISIRDGRGTGCVAIDPGEGVIRITSKSPDNGTAVERVPAVITDKPVQIGFNAQYLLDALATFRAENVTLHILDASAPAQMSDEAAGVSSMVVLMPMRV